jgi:hypothetical protein
VCKDGTTVATDEFSGYNILDRGTPNKFVDVAVNHSIGLYRLENGIHTNNIENFLSPVKR